MTSVCHVGLNHQALDTRIFTKEAQTLAGAGYDVTVIGTGKSTDIPQTINGVNIVPIPTNKGMLHRSDGVLNQARTILAGYRAAVRQHADIYHIHDPLSIMVGIRMAASGAKVIYDVHEFYDDWLLSTSDVSRIHQLVLSGLLYGAEPVLCRHAAGVITVDEGMTRYDKYGAITVHNFQPRDMFTPPTNHNGNENGTVRVLIDGGFQESRCTLEVIQAVHQASKKADVRLDAWGHFWDNNYEVACRQYIRRRSLDRIITIHDPVSHQMMPDIVRQSDIGVIPLNGVWNERARYPNKLSQFAGTAVPVIAAGGNRLGDLVGEIRCGIRSGTSTESLARSIIYLTEHDDARRQLGKNGRQAVESWMNWETEAGKLLDLYRRVAE